MAFIDELQLYIRSGKGGDGVVRFRHEKSREFMGPAGGDGGRGGDVYVKAVKNAAILEKYRHTKSFEAQNGEAGSNNSCHGRDGEDLYIDFPIGSLITNTDTGETWELLEEGTTYRILRGGDGGFGNEHFKSSVNQAPKRATLGKEGQDGNFHIELQLFADAGLIGFPNVGKSTILNTITNAQSKIGNFHFTTLEPHLGALYEFVLADIPGLIEGASEGKGLGHKFLRHIKRTSLLIHCIAASTEDVVVDYETVRKELENFDEELALKKEIIVITKCDEVDEGTLETIKNKLSTYNKDILTLTVLDDASVKTFSDSLVELLREEAK